MRILVTGATGYIGGHLVPLLLDRGHTLRVLARDPARLSGQPWASRVEIAQGDLLDSASLPPALAGIDAAFYLVHSMSGRGDFAETDRRAARNFAAAASTVPRVIYLGGLQPRTSRRSKHLSSRAEVGEILRQTLPCLELRAGPIIGSGSSSFEMVRYLTERLPAMVAPRWITNAVQPIGVSDMIEYLLQAVDSDATGIVEVGSEPLTFKEMMKTYAALRGLHRLIVPVPVLAPRLAALWVQLVTPIPNRIAIPLIEGVVSPVLADTTRARELFPAIRPVSYRDAVALALEAEASSFPSSEPEMEEVDSEGIVREIRTTTTSALPQDVFAIVSMLGGRHGWLAWDLAWKARAAVDRISGGPAWGPDGRTPEGVSAGQRFDFWEIEAAEKDRLLRLSARMKLPGRGWLQWEIAPYGTGSRVTQTAFFRPRGLAGVLYWRLLHPIHRRIFTDLAHAIAERAELRRSLLDCAAANPD